MTTQISANPATAPEGGFGTHGAQSDASPQAPRSALTFDGVLRSEWIKLLSLRSIRWSIVAALLVSLAGAGFMAFAVAGTEYATPEAMPGMLVQSATIGTIFTVLILGVLGVLSASSEYASGMILSTLAAVPGRTPVFLAKGLVVAAVGFVVAALGAFGGALIAALILGGDALAALGTPEVFGSLLSTSVYLMLATMFSFGVGLLLRSSAGGISTMVVVFFVLPIVFQIMMMTGWEWVTTVADWLPTSLGNTLAQAPMGEPNSDGGVSYWGALGGLAAWAAAALAPAAILFKTRDAV